MTSATSPGATDVGAQPAPLPGPVRKKAIDLVPGDVYVDYRNGATVTVEILGSQEKDENWFGLPWFKYLAKSGDRTGYVKFGPTGTVVLA